MSAASGRICTRLIVLRVVEIAGDDFLHIVGPTAVVLHSTGSVYGLIGVEKGV